MNTASPSLLQAAHAAVAGQQLPAGALYVVATPIGNLADITLRAIHVLEIADAIACEDTRHSAPLLAALGIAHKPLLALHEHNEREAARTVVDRLGRGERVACISDAGTPAVSDPGAALVAAVRAAGHRVLPIPGPSSVATAVSAAGDAAGSGFVFAGFLPAKGGERTQAIAAIVADARTQVLFEAPHRIEAAVRALADACPARPLTLCRELTKQFETIATMACGAAPAWLAGDAHRGRGEFVLVLHAAAIQDAEASAVARHDAPLRALLAAVPLKQAVALAAELSGSPRNALYERALALRREADEG